jgi:hypothetical protein
MAFDDLPLNRPTSPPANRRGDAQASPTRWIVLAASAIALAALLALWWMSRARPGPVTPTPTNATDVAVGTNRPKRQPLDLPALDTSDAFLREMVATLSSHPLISRLLATDGIVRNTALAIEQIGNGRTPALPLKVLRPSSRLAIVGTDTGRVDARTYARWDAATTSLVAIRPGDAAQLYVNVKPLFDEAYRELGHPNGDFDASLVRAIQMLNDTPPLAADPDLLRRPGYYEHTDATLRSLPPVQKQFLLIGPENREKILAWLKRFATSLDLKIGATGA